MNKNNLIHPNTKNIVFPSMFPKFLCADASGNGSLLLARTANISGLRSMGPKVPRSRSSEASLCLHQTRLPFLYEAGVDPGVPRTLVCWPTAKYILKINWLKIQQALLSSTTFSSLPWANSTIAGLRIRSQGHRGELHLEVLGK